MIGCCWSLFGRGRGALLALAFLLEEGLVHEGVVLAYHLQRLLLATLHDEPAYNHLLQNEVCLVEVEDQVQLADIAKVAVKDLDEVMDDVEDDELVVFLLDAGNEVERGIPKGLSVGRTPPYLLKTSLYSRHSRKCVSLLERPITIVPIYQAITDPQCERGGARVLTSF